MKEGDIQEKTHRKSLKLLGTVGEPINPEADVYYNTVGMLGVLLLTLGGKRNWWDLNCSTTRSY